MKLEESLIFSNTVPSALLYYFAFKEVYGHAKGPTAVRERVNIHTPNPCRKLPPHNRARICKHLRSPGIDSKESIPPAFVARQTVTSNRVVVPARQAENRFLGPLKRFKNTGSGNFQMAGSVRTG
jgi:hypothetical protein